jgi:AMMECR1 domain-containing protein
LKLEFYRWQNAVTYPVQMGVLTPKIKMYKKMDKEEQLRSDNIKPEYKKEENYVKKYKILDIKKKFYKRFYFYCLWCGIKSL